jgi:hypothetical protein
MPKYSVEISERWMRTVEVYAADEDMAKDQAQGLIEKGHYGRRCDQTDVAPKLDWGVAEIEE